MRRAWLAWAGRRPAREAVIVALLLLFARPALLPDPQPIVGAMNDDGIYVALGRAIANGEGYRSVYLPGDPVQVRYPPGLPVVLAVLWRVDGTLDGVAALALALNAILIALAASLLYWLGRTRLRLHAGLAALFAVGPFLLEPALLYSELILSEPYFVAGWAAALVLAYRVAELEPGSSRLFAAAALGLLLAATTLVRTHAVALLPALFAALLLKRIGAAPLAALATGALAPLLAWYRIHARWVAAGPLSTAADEVSYVAWTGIDGVGDALRTAGAAAFENTLHYVVMFSYYLSDLVLAGFLLVIAFAVLGIGGGLRRLRNDPGIVLSTAAVAAMTLAWPGTQDRLVLPMLPFAGLLAAAEIQRLLEGAGRRGRIVTIACLGVAALSIALRQFTMRSQVNAALLAGEAAEFYTPSDYVRRSSRILLQLSAWVRANTQPDDRILVAYPAGVYLHSGRTALPAEPAQPTVGRWAFEVRGAYLASQILWEDPTILVVHSARRDTAPIARDAEFIRLRCPTVLAPLPSAPQGFSASYRIRAAEQCLAPIARRMLSRSAAGAAALQEMTAR